MVFDMGGPPDGDDSTSEATAHPTLLAVDLGLRTGLAVFARDGSLVRYRSTHFPNIGVLKKALPKLWDEAGAPAWVVCEGDRHLASLWERLCARRGGDVLWTSAEEWRAELLTARERADTAHAKQAADGLARRAIELLGGRRPTSLTHDVAEAILIGVWGLVRVGWLSALPAGLVR